MSPSSTEKGRGALPRTREAIDALPYRLEYGHWGLTASVGDPRHPTILATAYFPISARGPFDPPHVQDWVFAELDAKARGALEARATGESSK